MNINFELYKVFYYVASTLSFSEASEKLFITQSAVSQSIKLLEEKLNCRLFFRNTKKVKLTKEGEILYHHIEQAFHLIRAGERNIEEMHSLMQGEIRIGASDTICKFYLLPYIEKFIHLYPRIKIHVTNRTSPLCIELLRRGSVDFSVINVPENLHSSDIEIQEMEKVQDVFIAGKMFSELRNRCIKLEDLKEYPVLMLEKNTTTRQFFDSFLEKHRIAITPEVELGSIELLIELTKIGLGISFVPYKYVEKELERDELFVIHIKEKIPDRSLGIITSSSIPLPIAASKFLEMLKGDRNGIFR